MNIEPIRIYGKDDIDNYRNKNGPQMLDTNPTVTFSSSLQNEKEIREVKNDDEVTLPEFEDTIDNDCILSKCNEEEESSEEEEPEPIIKKKGNVFGSPSSFSQGEKGSEKEKKPFSRNSLIYLAMGISLLKFL